jgi:hypothetical protein
MNTVQKNTALFDANKEVGLEVNTKKTKSVLIPRYQNAGKIHNIKRVNRAFENMAKFRYLGTTVTDQNFIHEEIKSRLNLCNDCYH